MRLFLIDRITLHDLADHPCAPQSGDVIAYLRHGVAVGQEQTGLWDQRGVRVLWADGVLDERDENAVNAFVDAYLNGWHRRDGDAHTAPAPLSLGWVLAPMLVGPDEPGLVVRFGAVVQRLLRQWPQCREIVSDVVDGLGPLRDLRVFSGASRRRALLADMVRADGRVLTLLDPQDPLRYWNRPVQDQGFFPLVRSLIGGLRPAYLKDRLKARRRGRTRPAAYFFLNHGLSVLARALADRGAVDVAADQPLGKGVCGLRHDHGLPLPDLQVLAAAVDLRRAMAGIGRETDGRWRFDGWDYGPFLRRQLHHCLSWSRLLPAIVKISQTRRMLESLKPQCVVLNSDFSVPLRAAIEWACRRRVPPILIDHGLNPYPYDGFPVLGGNVGDLIAVTPGLGHWDYYGRRLAEPDKPKRVNIAHTLTLQIREAAGKRPDVRKVMVTNYGPCGNFTCKRAKWIDRYYLDVVEAAKELAADGISLTLRPHHEDDFEFIRRLTQEARAEGVLNIDNSASIADALLTHGAVVTNVSTVYYQSVSAGWPTIFHQPDFRRSDFIGPIADPDLNAPASQTASELAELIRAAFRSDSTVARYPDKFRADRLDHYLGAEQNRCVEALCDLVESMSGASADDSGKAP